jgi:hypothetical protein
VTEAFCQCAAARLRIVGSDAASGAGSSGREWLQAEDREEERGADAEVAGALLRTAEGLVCVLHNCALAGTGLLTAQAAQRVAGTADRFPSHSFTRQVARWIRDLQLK